MPAQERRRFILDKKAQQQILAWNRIIPFISARSRAELVRFGERYGISAMINRARLQLQNRRAIPLGYIERVRQGLSFLVGMNRVWSKSKKTTRKASITREIIELRKRAKFVKQFAEVAEPMVRTVLTLAVRSHILERYLKPKELTELDESFVSGEDWDRIKQIISHRSGTPFPTLIEEVKREVEDDLVVMWAETIHDAQVITRSGQEASSFADLVQSYQKGVV